MLFAKQQTFDLIALYLTEGERFSSGAVNSYGHTERNAQITDSICFTVVNHPCFSL